MPFTAVSKEAFHSVAASNISRSRPSSHIHLRPTRCALSGMSLVTGVDEVDLGKKHEIHNICTFSSTTGNGLRLYYHQTILRSARSPRRSLIKASLHETLEASNSHIVVLLSYFDMSTLDERMFADIRRSRPSLAQQPHRVHIPGLSALRRYLDPTTAASV